MTALTLETYESFVKANRFAVVHFWASWNGHDKRMKNFLTTELPGDVGRSIAIGTFDTDSAEHHEFCRQLKILNLPFLAFYRDGKMVDSQIGFGKPSELLERLSKLVA